KQFPAIRLFLGREGIMILGKGRDGEDREAGNEGKEAGLDHKGESGWGMKSTRKRAPRQPRRHSTPRENPALIERPWPRPEPPELQGPPGPPRSRSGGCAGSGIPLPRRRTRSAAPS